MLQRLNKLKEKLKPMSGIERIIFLWTYYKFHLFAIVLVIILLVTVIASRFNANKETLLSGVYANVDVSEAGWDYLRDDFLTYMNGDPETQTVVLSATTFSGIYTDANNFDATYSSVMNPVAMVSGGGLDYFVMDSEAMQFYMTQEVLCDLSEYFTNEELAALGEKVIYLELVDENDVTVSRSPVALDISELPFTRSCLTTADNCYFSVAENAPNTDTVRIFWDYLHGWSK